MSSDTKVLLEYFDDKFARLLENIEVIIDARVRPIVKEEIEPLKQDIKIIKKSVTETNQDLRTLEKRVTLLEAAA